MLYVTLIDAFGWSWEYIDEEMTLPRMEAIAKRWETVPPLSVSVAGIAAALGIKREPKKTVAEEQNIDELAALFGGISRKPEWLTKTE